MCSAGSVKSDGQQAEARHDRGPGPARGLELEQRDLQRIAGLGAIDVDRAGDRVDQAEVQRA
jgi:hypothetical protein